MADENLDTFYSGLAELGYQREGDAMVKRFPRQQQQAAQLKPSTPVADTQQTVMGQDFIKNLDQQLSTIQGITDPGELAKREAMLAASIAAKQTDFVREARAAAHTKYGVADLEKQLQEMKAYEQSIPQWTEAYGSTDSDEVAAIRTRVMQVKAAADDSIPELLSGNSAYQSLMAYAKTALKTVATTAEKNLNKAELMAMQAEQSLAGVSQGTRDQLGVLTGVDPKNAIALKSALTFGKDQNEREKMVAAAELAGDPEKREILPIAALEGNVYARALWEKQSPKDKAAIGTLFELTSRPDLAIKEVQNLQSKGLIKEDKAKELMSGLNVQTLAAKLGSTKEAIAVATKARIELAMEIGKAATKTKFTQDLGRLESTEPKPVFLSALENNIKAGSGNGTISLDAAIIEAKKAPDVRTQQANIDALRKWYKGAITEQNKSLFFKIDSMADQAIPSKAIAMGMGFGTFERYQPAVKELIGSITQSLRPKQEAFTPPNPQEFLRQQAERRGGN